MRACATANAIALGLVAAALGFSACSNTPTPPQPASPEGPAAAMPPVDSPPLSAPKEMPTAKPPRTARDCKELASEITNEPPAGGVVLNNAMTARDAGASDRFEPLTELIRSKRDGFRCCFDLWAHEHPGAQGGMKMVVKLKPDGSVVSVTFGDAPSRVQAPDVEACMADLATGLPYPKSPSGKETTFTYPFDFKARR